MSDKPETYELRRIRNGEPYPMTRDDDLERLKLQKAILEVSAIPGTTYEICIVQEVTTPFRVLGKVES